MRCSAYHRTAWVSSRFFILPDSDQRFGGLGVVHPHHVLFNDGAFIKFCGHKVGRGADEFHTALMGLAIGVGTLEAGQERVVNVNNLTF